MDNFMPLTLLKSSFVYEKINFYYNCYCRTTSIDLFFWLLKDYGFYGSVKFTQIFFLGVLNSLEEGIIFKKILIKIISCDNVLKAPSAK